MHPQLILPFCEVIRSTTHYSQPSLWLGSRFLTPSRGARAQIGEPADQPCRLDRAIGHAMADPVAVRKAVNGKIGIIRRNRIEVDSRLGQIGRDCADARLERLALVVRGDRRQPAEAATCSLGKFRSPMA